MNLFSKDQDPQKTNKQLSLFEPNDIVYVTTDYSMFKTIKGNRELDPLNLKRITRSMKQEHLFTVVTINEFNEVIDGQHRIAASKELGLPVWFTIKPGYGLPQVKGLNINSKSWDGNDYLGCEVALGNENYIRLQELHEKYPEFPQISLRYIAAEGSTYITKNNVKVNSFASGDMIIKDIEKVIETIEKISQFKPYFKGYTRRVFVATMLSLFKQPNYIHDEMIAKLKLQPGALYVCNTIGDYKILIETIYNYKRRDKVNLRY